MAKKKFIAKAIKHPGALRATAKRLGYTKGNKPIPMTALHKMEHSANPTTARRARLAETMRSFHH